MDSVGLIENVWKSCHASPLGFAIVNKATRYTVLQYAVHLLLVGLGHAHTFVHQHYMRYACNQPKSLVHNEALKLGAPSRSWESHLISWGASEIR